MRMLCKLWKCWYSYVGPCKDGPEHDGRVVTVVKAVPLCKIQAVQVKRVLCALRFGVLYEHRVVKWEQDFHVLSYCEQLGKVTTEKLLVPSLEHETSLPFLPQLYVHPRTATF